jgi:hypothetical protein
MPVQRRNACTILRCAQQRERARRGGAAHAFLRAHDAAATLIFLLDTAWLTIADAAFARHCCQPASPMISDYQAFPSPPKITPPMSCQRSAEPPAMPPLLFAFATLRYATAAAMPPAFSAPSRYFSRRYFRWLMPTLTFSFSSPTPPYFSSRFRLAAAMLVISRDSSSLSALCAQQREVQQRCQRQARCASAAADAAIAASHAAAAMRRRLDGGA